jgi:hypothetical protein
MVNGLSAWAITTHGSRWFLNAVENNLQKRAQESKKRRMIFPIVFTLVGLLAVMYIWPISLLKTDSISVEDESQTCSLRTCPMRAEELYAFDSFQADGVWSIHQANVDADATCSCTDPDSDSGSDSGSEDGTDKDNGVGVGVGDHGAVNLCVEDDLLQVSSYSATIKSEFLVVRATFNSTVNVTRPVINTKIEYLPFYTTVYDESQRVDPIEIGPGELLFRSRASQLPSGRYKITNVVKCEQGFVLSCVTSGFQA